MGKRHILMLLIFTILLTFFTDLSMKRVADIKYPMENLNGHWEVFYNDQKLGDTDYNGLRDILDFPVYDQDTITLRTVLPDLSDLVLPAIYYRNRHCAFELYIDGALYQSYEMEAYNDQTFIGRNNYLISLPQDYAGRTIDLKLYPANLHADRTSGQGQHEQKSLHNAYYYAFHNPSHFSLGNYQDLEQSFVHKYYNELVCGSTLKFLGIVFLIISIFFSILVKPMPDHILTSILFILMGVGAHSYYGITFIFGDGTYDTFMVDLAIYLSLPVAMTMTRLMHRPKYMTAHIIAEIATLLYSVIRILLHMTNVLYLNEMYYLSFIPIAMIMGSIINGYLAEAKAKKLTGYKRMQYAGIFFSLIMLVFAYIITELRFLQVLPNTPFMEQISIELLADGILFFEVANIITYLAIISDSLNQNTEYDILTRVAFEDVLTKLPNRALITKKLNDLEHGAHNYCIISLDVNDLKRVNDTYGHESGDRLLSNFGRILDEVFHKDGISGRLGGDEFVVLIKNTTVQHIHELFQTLDQKLQEFSDQDEDEWEYHAAYGYAFRTECKDEHSTYLLADQRMYEHKKEVKARKKK
ncbi:MAG: GGDEF domain-containing protein [Lachnospiraceae bacterium]|nr:GGDEF domain-containing protein [Lachnospiraceae bacterium]